jgi:hypothetical protein
MSGRAISMRIRAFICLDSLGVIASNICVLSVSLDGCSENKTESALQVTAHDNYSYG